MSLPAVQQAVQSVQSWLDDPPGEAVVRQCIVLRLLQAAGFDIWNPLEVVPEETNATGNRADFLIRRGLGKFALEIKGMGVTVGPKEYQQAATYAVNEGTRWAVVTNGRVWTVIDEHLPGKWEDRVALKIEIGDSEGFVQDFSALFATKVWEADTFNEALEQVKARQKQRRDEERIRREKTPLVKELQGRYGITFEQAVEIGVGLMNFDLTEYEGDVLLGNVGKSSDEVVPPPSDATVEFTYSPKSALACAIYDPVSGSWTVKAGSTALKKIHGTDSSAASCAKRRAEMQAKGQLRELDAQLLEYVTDVTYSSPSTAAVDIAGGSRSGWDMWKDAQGRPAQHYRPSK